MTRPWVQTLLPACLLLATLGHAQAGQWLDVPFIKQSPEGCGAASVAMVMQYWDAQQSRPSQPSSDADSILRDLYSKKDRGILASKIESYFGEHGYNTYSFRGQWIDLEQHIAKGRPLIVALQPKSRRAPLHYVVIAGIDSAQQQVLYNDPAGRKLQLLDRFTFEKQWRATEFWTLLAVPRSS